MIKNNMVHRAVGLVVITLVAQVVLAFSPIVQSSVSAATEHPQDTLQRWLYYRGMRACLENGLVSNSELSRDDVLKGQWEPASDKDGFGYLAPDMDDNDDNDGTVDCSDGSIWVRGATLYGFKDAVELLCEINRGLQTVGDGSRLTPNSDDCEKSTKFDVVRNGKWNQALTKAFEKNGTRPAFQLKDNATADPMRYLIGARSLETFCGGGTSLASGVDDLANDNNAVIVDIVNADGTIEQDKTYRLSGERNEQGDKVDDVYYNDGGSDNEAQDLKCEQLAKMTNDYSGAYSKWVLANQDVTPVDETGGSGGESAVAETTSCAIDNIGWIVCPVLNFMARIVDVAYKQIASWLGVTPLATTASSDGRASTMYSAWGVMRNIANIAFVIAFMIIIYSQLTSVGISNYGVKKLLPKILVAVILVNVSYWVCAIAVDVSNIAGASLYKLFDGDVFSEGINTSEFAGDLSSTGNGWTGLVSALLASAALYVALPALIVALPAALFAIVTVFLVLALRQVLIILLVVISPLAFVALLLPNTEDWFKKWRTLFQTLLLMYPIIAVIFGASAMASTIVMSSATDISGDGKIAIQLMGALITILPLAITPIVMKVGGGLLGRFGGMVNNSNKGPFDAMRKRTDKFAGRIRNRREAGGLSAASGILSGDKAKTGFGSADSRRRRAYAAIRSGGKTMSINADEKDKYAELAAAGEKRGYVSSRVGREENGFAQRLAGGGNEKLAQQVQDYARQANSEERIKDIKAATARIDHLDNSTVARIAATGIHEGKAASKELFAAATHRIQDTGSFDERMESLAFLAANKGDSGKELGADSTLRAEAAQKSIARGDSKILGAGFGNDLVREASKINRENFEAGPDGDKKYRDAINNEIKGGDVDQAMASIKSAAVRNASGGALNAQHLVQGDASTKFLVQSIKNSTDDTAKKNLKAAADLARSQTSTAAGVTEKINKQFEDAGSYAPPPGTQP